MYLLRPTSPSRRRTRSPELPIVRLAASTVATGIASESYAFRNAPHTRSIGNATRAPCVATMGLVDIVIDPAPPDTRTDSIVDAGPGVALEDAHPPAIANTTITMP